MAHDILLKEGKHNKERERKKNGVERARRKYEHTHINAYIQITKKGRMLSPDMDLSVNDDRIFHSFCEYLNIQLLGMTKETAPQTGKLTMLKIPVHQLSRAARSGPLSAVDGGRH